MHGPLTIGTPVVLEARLLSCDGALRNEGLGGNAANPPFSCFRNDLNVRVTGIPEQVAMLLDAEERHASFFRVSLRSF